ncbi:ATP-dependent helicase HrpB [Limimaricola pyoseonensis]|uniref:ATP-dependent helicase HrpB n=1 Tax=Limimaricola pyoseonensis TaxID=521013 RepID=A0A1G7GAN9_9RHOB|nr:ATP-dependent helicase HrpB [Limimaricola pyoseonensis]SDE85167.1 ATP-dependent helicase HrpB [Limimaricola pyoseonensis]
MTRLPIDDALPELISAVARAGQAVLQAPPGAGKTTRVPLALLDRIPGRIVMLEPRRLAARAAAQRMAKTLGERVGETVGFRIRGESKVSKATRIEVVTEGILTRMIQSDPELPGVGAVIFDEFHERSLNADLGLALCLEIRGALREDLVLIAMSATLDAGPVAELMGAPVVTSEGRSFPVETRWLDRPLGPRARLEAETAALVERAVTEAEGGVLVFLPGEGEIRRVQGLLSSRLPACEILPLYGALPPAQQAAALEPGGEIRRVVLATAIAETSLTIPDIRVVVDAGRARRARFDPGSGMSRLVTEKVTRAEAAQRAGRAGRVAPGVCYRLWTRGEEGALSAFPDPEIASADLAPLALELAQWGSDALPFLTPPPGPALAEAKALLRDLGALDGMGTITPHGCRLAALPLHPRLGHMLEVAGAQAAPLAALMGERDPLRGAGSDLGLRLRAAKGARDLPAAPDMGVLARVRDEAKRLARGRADGPALSVGAMAALAYPDRIGLRRPGDDPRWLLSGGKGAMMEASDPLAGARLIVATDLSGDATEAKIRQAARIEETELRELFADRIEEVSVCEWSKREGRVTARLQERLGAIALSDRIWREAPDEAVARAMLEGVRQLGLRPSPAAQRFRARVMLLRDGGAELPDLSDEALMATLEGWLLPFLGRTRSAYDWKGFDLLGPWRAMLDWNQTQLLDREAPPAFTTPLGRQVPIDYDSQPPEIALRLQELFGVTRHPTVGGTALKLTLLSPAGRPVQVTDDLPGFWASSYADVRKDMRGRYPRHPWPEDPTEAAPTLRAKPRGQ